MVYIGFTTVLIENLSVGTVCNLIYWIIGYLTVLTRMALTLLTLVGLDQGGTARHTVPDGVLREGRCVRKT